MSDETKGPASSAEPSIPKSRLDEVIAERNAERAQTQFLQQTLAQVIANQRTQTRAPERDTPEMEQLKVDNPALYNQIKAQNHQLKILRAANFETNDKFDRATFLQGAGKEGQKRLNDIEAILDRERQAGNMKADRMGIYQWMLGQEKLREQYEAANRPQTTQQAAPAPATTQDAPSSDPQFATTVRSGAAAPGTVEKTREERIAELANQTF